MVTIPFHVLVGVGEKDPVTVGVGRVPIATAADFKQTDLARLLRDIADTLDGD